MNKKVTHIDLGLISYHDAWVYQLKCFNTLLEQKKQNKNLLEKDHVATHNYLIFCEHFHVYTLGRNGQEKNLLIDKEQLNQLGASFYQVERGGDITYHGPGQIVVYPVIDLENFFTDIHRYMRMLEESVIRTLAEYSIDTGRIDGLTGVWIDSDESMKARKIAAFGVKTSRWVTLHGLALNVNVTLDYFNHIVPCGVKNKSITSMEKEIGSPQPMNDIKRKLLYHIVDLFEMV